MSGVSVIWFLLKSNAPVLAALGAGPPPAASRIMAGDLPQNTVMPAIAVTQVSAMPDNRIKINEALKMHTDRVQVSWIFKSPNATPPGTGYPGVAGMSRLVLAACPSQRGTINGISVDSIVPDIEGPDLSDDATQLHSRSRDFIVKWIGP